MASNYFNKASLVMIPDAPLDGKVLSIKPEDRSGDFTFSRGSNLSATRVDANGLIEKGRENLLLQSNQFDTTWSTSNASVTGGQSGYDGSSDAWLLNGTGSGGRVEQNISLGGVKVFSVYAKAGTTDGIVLRVLDGANNPYVFWSLADGSYQGATGGGGINPSTQNVENVGSGWYRFQITTSTTINQVIIYTGNSSGGFATGTIYIQDAQVEQSLVATDYIETGASTAQAGILEDLPRLDYSGGASCPALLLEPSRTNIIPHSEYFGDWNTSQASVALGSLNSPTGNTDTYVLTQSISGYGSVYKISATTIGTTYTFSVFAKAGTSNNLGLEFRSPNTGIDAVFDLSNGTLTSGSGSIEDYGNGWYRCSITETANNSSAFFLIGRGASGLTGDTTNLFGAQVEVGAYATSYIPTYGTTVTRSQDSMQVASGISNLLPQGTGTMYIEGTIKDAVDTEGYLMRIEQASFSNTIFIARSSAGNLFVSYRNNNSTIFSIQKNNVADTFKAAFAFESGNSVLYVNGEQISTSSATYTPAVIYDDIRLGGYSANTANMSGVLSQGLVFKTRLTNEELAALTTI